MSRTTFSRRALPALALAALLVSLGQAGGDKGGAWKAYLPAAAQQELKARAQKAVEMDPKRKEVEAFMVKGYELANKGGASLKLGAPSDLADMMNLLRIKAKGGEGTAEALQYNAKLKNLNNIEALIGALATKQLTDDNVAKTSKELELLAYRLAVMGSITHDNAPSDRVAKDQVVGWQKLSLDMRDASVALAQAASKKDAAGVQKASTRLEASCTQCHRDYRK
jgi:hypothetical protein